jgi:hypothetical protein
MYIPVANRQRNFHFFELVLITVDITLTRQFAPQQAEITLPVSQQAVSLKKDVQIDA